MIRIMANRWRRPRREVSVAAPPEPAAEDLGLERLLDDAGVRSRVAELPPRTRAVLVLRYVEERSDEEIARLLGCSRGSVKSKASRGWPGSARPPTARRWTMDDLESRLATLLGEPGAADPPPDLAGRIHRAVATRRRNRRTAWLAALACVTAVLVAVPLTLRDGGGDTAATVDPAPRPTVTVTVIGPPPAARSPPGPSRPSRSGPQARLSRSGCATSWP
ncbi:RNA polymerase sigma factor [Nonomuraea rubra]|uniref:RNA polymerase sigma factor n=1 Tax=Nonomuraea rubra TaxID=46180 RepID=UPI003613560F